MITPEMIKSARAALRLSQSALASLAGVSRATLASIEGGSSDFRVSSVRAIEAAIEEKGLVVRGDRVFEKVWWPPGMPNDSAIKAGALLVINAARKRDGLPLVIDED